MRFKLYSQLTVKQCMSGLTDRMEAKATATRPAIDGWIKKGGAFSLSMRAPVIFKIHRTTRIQGVAARESGVTVIKGRVNTGVPPERAYMVIGAVALASLAIMFTSDPLLGLLGMGFGLALYIPLVGDHNNSQYLLKEVRRACKAKDKPPR